MVQDRNYLSIPLVHSNKRKEEEHKDLQESSQSTEELAPAKDQDHVRTEGHHSLNHFSKVQLQFENSVCFPSHNFSSCCITSFMIITMIPYVTCSKIRIRRLNCDSKID